MREKASLKKFEKKDNGEIYDLTDEDMPTQLFDGERMDMEDVLDRPIIVKDMEIRPSSFSEGDYIILQIELDGDPRVVLTGSLVLVRQLKEKADKIPFRCRIIAQQSAQSKYKYYTLAPAGK